MILTAYFVFTLFFWLIFYFAFKKDRSRYRNCYLLFIAIVVTLLSLTAIAGDYQFQVLSWIFIALFIALLIVPFFLVINGIIMIRREGRSLANLLSLVFGIVIGLGEIATFAAVFLPEFFSNDWTINGSLFQISRFSMFVSVSVIYISMCFVIFMIYCVFLQIIPKKRDFDYVIIHGAGLIDGDRISKLLSERIDKAIDVYHKDPTPPILIPSGGKGSDEKLAEAEAMEKYLLDKGIPADKIIKEDKSTTTFENLENSKAIIEASEDGKYTALVTSNYHVYRALRYARKIGLNCTGIGSHVAFYYWPSALIREFIAVHAEPKHLFFLILGWLVMMYPLLVVYFDI